MYEYIERETIKAAMIHYGFKSPDMTVTEFVEDELPAADVAPVRHGRWICIRKGYGEYECSVCHGEDSDCSDYYGTHVVTEQDYCPNCGSRMDGDYDE